MNKRKKIFAIIIFCSSLLYFLTNLSPTVTYGDSAEFIVGAYKLSIVHPSGYPTYLLLAKIFTFIPVGDVAYRVNMCSAFFGALSCYLIFLIIFELTESLLLSIVSTFTLSLSLTFSYLSTIAEIYTLNSFFVSFLIYNLILWDKRGEKKFLFSFSFLLGLSLTNHLTIITFFPSFFIFFLLNKSKISLKISDLSKLSALFLLGLTPYLYIPIRSLSSVEIIFWPKIKSINEFLIYISASHFKFWFFHQNIEELIKSISKFFSFLVVQFPGFGAIFGGIGFWYLWKNNKKTSLLLSLMFFSLMLFGINYKIEDIHHFYVPSYLVFTIWVGSGLLWLWKRTPSTVKHRALFYSFVLLMLLSYKLIYGILGIPSPLERSHYFSDSSKMSLLSTEKNSVIVCDWAYATLFRYWQVIYGLGKDAMILFDYDENWLKYVDFLYNKRKVYVSRFEKGVSSKYYLIPKSFIYQVTDSPELFKDLGAKPQYPLNFTFFEEIAIIGYDVLRKSVEKIILELILYWKALKKINENYNVELEVVDKKGKTSFRREFRPVYGFYSTEKWEEGEILKEKVNLYYPSSKISPFKINITLFDQGRKKFVKKFITLQL